MAKKRTTQNEVRRAARTAREEEGELADSILDGREERDERGIEYCDCGC